MGSTTPDRDEKSPKCEDHDHNIGEIVMAVRDLIVSGDMKAGKRLTVTCAGCGKAETFKQSEVMNWEGESNPEVWGWPGVTH